MKINDALPEIKEKVKDIMLTKGGLDNGYFYIHMPNHPEYFPIPPYVSMNDEMAKRSVNPMLKSLIEHYPNIDVIVMCTEAWLSTCKEEEIKNVKRPSEDPNRVECVMVAGIDTDGVVRLNIFPFERKPNMFTFIDDDRLNIDTNGCTGESRFFDGIFGYKYNNHGTGW